MLFLGVVTHGNRKDVSAIYANLSVK